MISGAISDPVIHETNSEARCEETLGINSGTSCMDACGMDADAGIEVTRAHIKARVVRTFEN